MPTNMRETECFILLQHVHKSDHRTTFPFASIQAVYCLYVGKYKDNNRSLNTKPRTFFMDLKGLEIVPADSSIFLC